MMKGLLRMLIVTGLSGSGKSSVLRMLEDAGFFCVDNLPILLLPKFYELCLNSPEISRSAIVMDIREGMFLKEYPGIFDELRQSGIPFEILFLDAADQVLERRFDQTRRPHPLSMTGTIRDGIARERDRLADLRHMADMVLDTSKFTIQDLKKAVTERYVTVSDGRSMTISMVSFGFSLGIPHNSDLVIDVRFLPNPYYIDALRDRNGLEEEVGEYILSFSETREFLTRFGNLLELLLPLYEREGKVHLVLAMGCTGGRHRSVFIVERMKEYLEERSYMVRIEHRDLNKAEVKGRGESRKGD